MAEELRIAIVGSRRRNTLTDRKIVFQIVSSALAAFPEKIIVVVSGGAVGPDTFAREAAEHFGVGYREYPIKRDPPITSRWEFVQRAFGRNRDIVIDSDIGFALVSKDRKGGTENTLEHADVLQKRYFRVDVSGRSYLDEEDWNKNHGVVTDQA